jgi:two-component system cell cycle response regulator CtrA
MTEIRDDYVAALETENDVLRERVSVLEEIIGLKMRVPLVFPFTAQEAKLFGFLMKRDLVTKENAMFVLYGTRAGGEEVEIKIIDVFVCRIRAKLKPFGIPIQTKWGQGYYLNADAKAKVEALIKATEDVAA